MQQKDMQQKKQSEKAAITAAADSEFREVIIDPAEQERIRRRQEGTPVTLETFNQWKKAFEDEMAAKELEALRSGGPVSNLAPLAAVTIGAGNLDESGANVKALLETLAADGRPTGKQYFMMNMGAAKGAGEGAEDPDAEDLEGPDELAEVLGMGTGDGGEGDSEDDDSDYVEGEEDDDDDDDDDGDFEDGEEES
jgi:hypothetical protein